MQTATIDPAHVAGTFTCPHCATVLVTERIAPGATVLCASCGGTAGVLPKADRRRISRKALASLTLGMAAMPFSCLAGIPAVLLGCIALQNIRRRPDHLKGRGLAIAGITTGGLFGVVCAPILLAMILPAIQRGRAEVDRVRAVQKAADPAVAVRVAASIAEFELPPGLKGIYGLDGPETGWRAAAFGCDTPSAKVMLTLVEIPASTPNAQDILDSRMKNWENTYGNYRIERSQQRSLTWQVVGRPVDVTVRSGQDANGKPRRNYTATFQHGKSRLAVLVSTGDEPPASSPAMAPGDPQSNLTEDEVRAFFESIRRPGYGKAEKGQN